MNKKIIKLKISIIFSLKSALSGVQRHFSGTTTVEKFFIEDWTSGKNHKIGRRENKNSKKTDENWTKLS